MLVIGDVAFHMCVIFFALGRPTAHLVGVRDSEETTRWACFLVMWQSVMYLVWFVPAWIPGRNELVLLTLALLSVGDASGAHQIFVDRVRPAVARYSVLLRGWLDVVVAPGGREGGGREGGEEVDETSE